MSKKLHFEREYSKEELLHFAALIESSEDAIIGKTLDGNITSWNKGAEKIYGYSSEEVIGKSISVLVPKDHPNEIPGILEKIKRGEQITHYETVRVKKKGEQIDVSLTISPVKDKNGNIIGASSIARDITARKHLEQSNRELQDFASIASHDLQEPLRKIIVFSDRIKTIAGDTLNEQGRDYMNRMQNAAGRMQILINDLLTYSRVSTKAQPFINTDIQQIAREVLSDLEIRIEHNGAKVELGELPTIEADPTQIRQLLQNLIGNALKFRKKVEPPIVKIYSNILDERRKELRLNMDPPQTKFCQIIVDDNGIGFDEKYLDRIFTIFQRLHSRNEYEGTGIGLAVCRRIAHRHGGDITAQSSLGKGSTFIVTMPIKQIKEERHE